jgi:hypothetical protein
MLLLTSTSDKIQVITGQAVNVDVHASYLDLASGTVTAGRTNTKISTATTTDVVASPGASTTRNVKTLHIANVHASSSVTVTLQHTDGTNVIQIESVTLLAGERIAYREGIGTRVVDANGQEKTNPNAAVQVYRLGSDAVNSTTTPANVAGLEAPCAVGTWIFEYFLLMQSALTTTGHRLSVNHDGTVTDFVAQVMWPGGTTAAADTPDQDFVAAGGQLLSGFYARAKSTAGWGTTLGVDTAAAHVLYTITGMLVCSVAGNIELWHGSEVAAESRVKAGSSLRLTRTG